MSPSTGAGPARALGILQLGDPMLWEQTRPVTDFASPEFERASERLLAALAGFRSAFGFGRAIAAPQLGIGHRMLAIAVDGFPSIVANPRITWSRAETFTMWDDCMSFPDLLVKVRRHTSISVAFQDREGREMEAERLDRATSELLQHEIDHLDGVLAVDRALPGRSLISRTAFERFPHYNDELDA